jgi:hypothetical protein
LLASGQERRNFRAVRAGIRLNSLGDKAMRSGTLTINGISDKDLIKILEIKTKYEGDLQFMPNAIQPINQAPQQPHRPGGPTAASAAPREQLYNNAVLNFTTDKGLKAVKEILHHLTEHEGA